MLAAMLFGLMAAADGTQAALTQVAASDKELFFTIEGGGIVSIVALQCFEEYAPGEGVVVLERVEAGEGPASAPRYRGKKDFLYHKYQLIDAASGKALGHPHYVTDLSAAPARSFEIPRPVSKKGITCVTDVDDAIAAGTKWVDEGVVQGLLIDWESEDPEVSWTVDGVTVGIHKGYLDYLDAKYKQFSEAGIHMLPIPINHVPTEPQPGNPLLHPDTDFANAPMHHGAFNLRSEEGVLHYRAMMEFLAERYTRPDMEHGWILGIVVGNELQSHWVWHNMGNAPKERVIEEYVWALRIADLAARRYHKDLKVYASMEHHWTKRGHMNDPMKEIRGDELLDGIAEWSHREGNFPWHLAHHPYPENLFDPEFWKDETALPRFDTPRITFKNLEVLAEYMRQDRFLYNGEMRDILLTEQGFHTPEGPDGEAIQAAAFAYAYHKVKHMPEIGALIMHRHTSMRDEGGLDLGMWTWDPDDPAGARPHKKKKLWHVYKAADTDRWEEAFAFALPIIGIETWDEALPDYTIDTRPRPVLAEDLVVFDLYDEMKGAKVENTMGWRSELVVKAAGWAANGILHHPPEEGTGTAEYDIPLPAPKEGERFVLKFETLFTAETTNGAAFGIAVNGESVWNHTQIEKQAQAHSVDLTPWAGEQIKLQLSVHGLGDVSHDWAVWVEPAIQRVPVSEG